MRQLQVQARFHRVLLFPVSRLPSSHISTVGIDEC
jgi:hypothetical protein